MQKRELLKTVTVQDCFEKSIEDCRMDFLKLCVQFKMIFLQTDEKEE